MKLDPISYHDYLKIDDLLACQELRSDQVKVKAHDEHLFIIVHQAYELWFKQIIRELNSVVEIMEQPLVNESAMGVVVSRLERIHEIQKLIAQHIDIMETMTPMDFLDFRDLLYPASGFQSYQFRVLENKLGLDPEKRLVYNMRPYTDHFADKQKENLLGIENGTTMFSCLEKWLERTPFLEGDTYNFWSEYKTAAIKMFDEEKQVIANNAMLNDEQKKANTKIIEQSQEVFESLFDENRFNELKKEGYWRLGYKSVLAALFIHLYRDQPVLHLPFRLITKLKDIDEALTHWRYRHSLMAKRMLGTKIGTGGSTGAKYLAESTERHKIFTDLFQLTTFFIPRSQLPKLPAEVAQQLDFFYNAK